MNLNLEGQDLQTSMIQFFRGKIMPKQKTLLIQKCKYFNIFWLFYSGDLKYDRSKFRTIWITAFLKNIFQMVWFSKGWAVLLDKAMVTTIQNSDIFDQFSNAFWQNGTICTVIQKLDKKVNNLDHSIYGQVKVHNLNGFIRAIIQILTKWFFSV